LKSSWPSPQVLDNDAELPEQGLRDRIVMHVLQDNQTEEAETAAKSAA
jgi:hypothetical protein